MPAYGESILSRVLDDGNILALREHEIKAEDFTTESERRVYQFILDYAKTNGGRTPDYRTVVESFPDFYYREGVEDSYAFMVRELKSFTAKRRLAELISGNPDKRIKSLNERLHATDGNALLLELIDELRALSNETNVRDKVGTDLKKDGNHFLESYRERKEGKSMRIWKSKFSRINDEIGGYFSGNMYTWFGRSGRGKSVFVMEEGLESAMQGATVLGWMMEMSKYEWLARAYSSLSARMGYFSAVINGITQNIGFQNKGLLAGSLSEAEEEALEEFLAELNDFMPGNVIIRCVDDEDFENRTVRQLEADIIRTQADVVIIDPFYYMQYESNTSRTKGGDAAETSKKLRALCGRTKSVLHVITQADEDGQQSDEEREINPPTRSNVKKTKAVLEDATNLFAIDTVDGQGAIQIGKGRNGGEGTLVEITYLPNYGIVKQSMDDLMEIAQGYCF